MDLLRVKSSDRNKSERDSGEELPAGEFKNKQGRRWKGGERGRNFLHPGAMKPQEFRGEKASGQERSSLKSRSHREFTRGSSQRCFWVIEQRQAYRASNVQRAQTDFDDKGWKIRVLWQHAMSRVRKMALLTMWSQIQKKGEKNVSFSSEYSGRCFHTALFIPIVEEKNRNTKIVPKP